MHLLPGTVSESPASFDIISHNPLHTCNPSSSAVPQQSISSRHELEHSINHGLNYSLSEIDLNQYQSLSMSHIGNRTIPSPDVYLHNEYMCQGQKQASYGTNFNINATPSSTHSTYNTNFHRSINSILSEPIIHSNDSMNNMLSLDMNSQNNMHSQLLKIPNYGSSSSPIFESNVEDGFSNVIKRDRGTSDSSFCSQKSNSSKSGASSKSYSSGNSAHSEKNKDASLLDSNGPNLSSIKIASKHVNNQMPFATLQISPHVLNDPRMMISSNMSHGRPNQNHIASSIPVDGYHSRNSFRLTPHSLYGYHSPLLGHGNTPLSGPISHPQFGNLLQNMSNLNEPTNFNPNTNQTIFSSQRGSLRNDFHSAGAPRYMVEGSTSHLVDESLPTFPNAAAAPNRLPAHKPVRLTQPKHPLAPLGTPVYFKYGEEHYPEETVPPEYTFTETDGTVCRYITNFLVYNKRGERLLPIEVLDQPRHAALVLYGSLLPSNSMTQGNNRLSKKDSDSDADGNRGKKRSSGIRSGNSRKRHMSSGGNSGVRDGVSNICSRASSILQSYPVRVELAEWCIDYGQEPSNVPFIWLISRWDVYYRLEKPAGRYIPTFATAKMKFEVSTRVIKTLQHRPDTEYKCLVELLTAATRLEKLQRLLEKKALLKKKRQSKKLIGKQKWCLTNDFVVNDHNLLGFSDTKQVKYEETSTAQETNNSNMVFPSISNTDEYYDMKHTTNDSSSTAVSQFSGSQTKKKNRNWRIQSLSTPQGTGVAITDEEGRPQALTPWGAPYAVEGLKESMLLGLAEFLESQLRNFMEGIGSIKDGTCPNLLNTSFMRQLRERTAYRMETLQLVEAKRRELEVVKSLAEAATSHYSSSNSGLTLETLGADINQPSMGNVPTSPLPNLITTNLGPNFMAYSQTQMPGNAQPSHSTNFTGRSNQHYFNNEPNTLSSECQSILGSDTSFYSNPTNLGLMNRNYNCSMLSQSNTPSSILATSSSINVLENEIRHLQQLLKDSDDNNDTDLDDNLSEEIESQDELEGSTEELDVDRSGCIRMNGCFSDNDRTTGHGSTGSPSALFGTSSSGSSIGSGSNGNMSNRPHSYNSHTQDFNKNKLSNNSFRVEMNDNQNIVGLADSMSLMQYSRSNEELFDFPQCDANNHHYEPKIY